MIEEWKSIPGYEGAYEVSNLGVIRSVDRESVDSRGRVYSLRGREIAPSTSKTGYKRVVLYAPGRVAKTYQVHRVVLEAFVGPQPAGLLCRHLNGDPSDNQVTNLVWGTPAENMFDKALHGTDHQRNKTHCPLGHELTTLNLQERKIKLGWRCCKACHQARSDKYNGSSLAYEELADMRYFMIMTGQVFKFGTRRGMEIEMFQKAKEWGGNA